MTNGLFYVLRLTEVNNVESVLEVIYFTSADLFRITFLIVYLVIISVLLEKLENLDRLRRCT